MADTLTPDERSERMSRVRNKDSKAEMRVRKLVHAMGFRYRLHNKTLPGKPDLVLARHKKVILIHGCFWHQHGVCRPLSTPEHNSGFWRKKFDDNVKRDQRNLKQLQELGWNVLVIWECETKDAKLLESKLRDFLTRP